MNNNDLTLLDIIKDILKNKLLFGFIFLLVSILSILYVLNIEKTYKSTMLAKLPLSEGIETEFFIDYLTDLKPLNLNQKLDLNDDNISIIELSIVNKRYQPGSIYCFIEFETNKPDIDSIVKNSFISYINNIDFFNTLKNTEKERYLDLIKTSTDEFNNNQRDNIISLNIDDENQFIVSSTDLKKIKHNATYSLGESKPIVEISYNVSVTKFKPSYSMLVVLSLIFAFFIALTTIIIKIVVKDTLKKINQIEE